MSERAAPSPWRSGRASVRGGVEIAFDEQGHGDALLLIMGIGAPGMFWDDRFCARLTGRGFRVIRFDHRDIGGSSRLDHLPVPRPLEVLARRAAGLSIDAPYDLSDMAGDVVGLLDHLGVQRAHVVGASMGGMVAQHLAIEHPARVASLVSIMSAPGSRRSAVGTRPRAWRALLGPAPRTAEESGEYAVRLVRALGGSRFDPDNDRVRAIGSAAFAQGRSPRGFLRQLAAVCKSGDRTRALAGVRVPTSVIHGTDDPLIPVAAGRATARAISGSFLHVIDGMGHHLAPPLWDRIVPTIMATIARA